MDQHALILIHVIMMGSIATMLALIAWIDRGWRFPWQWPAAFVILPLVMMLSGLGERDDSNLLRFIGLLFGFIGPILVVDGQRAFVLRPRPATRWIALVFAGYCVAAALAVFTHPSFDARLGLILTFHLVLAIGLLRLSRDLPKEDHRLSRAVILIGAVAAIIALTWRLTHVATVAPETGAPARMSLAVLGMATVTGVVLGVTFVIQVAERLAGQIRQQAMTDSLTGLASRRAFDQLLDREMARRRRYGRRISLILFDIDHFKEINDSHGHDIGDLALRRVAQAGSDMMRDTDIYARLGGDEFAVLLYETDLDAAERVALRLRDALRALEISTPDGRPVALTGSFGVTANMGDRDTPEALVKRADLAPYDVKRRGRDGVARRDADIGADGPSTPRAP